MIPGWALLISFWVHMLATVAWLGGLAALALFVFPSMRRTLAVKEFATWANALNRRLDPVGWFSLGILTFTGLLQMDGNPNYQGMLNISNAWSVAICLKHIVFLGMIAVSAVLTWSVAPALSRAALQQARGKAGGATVEQTLRRFQMLIAVNLLLGLLVLAFTAMARVA
ncbi:MAG: hypothetical protein KIT70_05340 [Anaerolineales bacterium]|nr:MAG: hypothetical protein KIT70_05340 [Anaerolineales bacterium]